MKLNPEKLFTSYNRFYDGLLLSFRYYYNKNEPLAAEIIVYAQNPFSKIDQWDEIKITITDVKELKMAVKGDQFNSIYAGIKLLKFEEVWCIDIDGIYPMDKDPKTLEEVISYGECYVIGRHVEAVKI